MSLKVRVEPSGREYEINPRESILDGALRHGLNFPYGCRNGSCGACKAKIIKGEVDLGDYQPYALSEEEKAAQTALLCCATPLDDIVVEVREVHAIGDIEVQEVVCKIVKAERLADDVMRVLLQLPNGTRLQFMAGQYMDILWGNSKRRSFSIANSPHDDALLEMHIGYVKGGEFTHYVFNEMRENDLLRLEGPYGAFYLREESSRPALFVAGGTGFAPIKGIIEHLMARDEGAVGLHLYWGARQKQGLYMAELVEQWRDHYSGIQYIPVLSGADLDWSGREGDVIAAVVEDFPDLSQHDVYVAGSPAMILAAQELFMAHGLSQQHLYADAFEFFSSTPTDVDRPA